MLRSVTHPHSFQCLVSSLAALPAAHAAIRQWQLHILVDGQISNQVEALEDETNLSIADPGALGERQVRYGPAIQVVAAFRGSVEKTKNRKQRRFTAARWSGN
jgi:hypothetical protein